MDYLNAIYFISGIVIGILLNELEEIVSYTIKKLTYKFKKTYGYK